MFAVQPHREVGPGSWLVKAYRITTPFWAESGKEGEEGTWRLMYSQLGEGGICPLLFTTATSPAASGHLPDLRCLRSHYSAIGTPALCIARVFRPETGSWINVYRP